MFNKREGDDMATNQTTRQKEPQIFPPLALETRTHISTDHCAFLLGRASQTLRIWACYESKGPLRPVRVNGRLAWPVAEIRRVLGVQA